MPLSPTDARAEPGAPSRLLALAPLHRIPSGRGLRVCASGHDIALFRVGETIHAIDDSCPHRGASLSAGRLLHGIVACPAHGLQFDVRSGCGTALPPLRNRSYPVQVVDGVVMLDLTTD